MSGASLRANLPHLSSTAVNAKLIILVSLVACGPHFLVLRLCVKDDFRKWEQAVAITGRAAALWCIDRIRSFILAAYRHAITTHPRELLEERDPVPALHKTDHKHRAASP